MPSDSKTLIGRDAICKHLGISETLYYKLIKEEGLPVYKKFRRAIANKDLLDEWSQRKVLKEITIPLEEFLLQPGQMNIPKKEDT